MVKWKQNTYIFSFIRFTSFLSGTSSFTLSHKSTHSQQKKQKYKINKYTFKLCKNTEILDFDIHCMLNAHRYLISILSRGPWRTHGSWQSHNTLLSILSCGADWTLLSLHTQRGSVVRQTFCKDITYVLTYDHQLQHLIIVFQHYIREGQANCYIQLTNIANTA